MSNGAPGRPAGGGGTGGPPRCAASGIEESAATTAHKARNRRIRDVLLRQRLVDCLDELRRRPPRVLAVQTVVVAGGTGRLDLVERHAALAQLAHAVAHD